jgi:hypothetical protein
LRSPQKDEEVLCTTMNGNLTCTAQATVTCPSGFYALNGGGTCLELSALIESVPIGTTAWRIRCSFALLPFAKAIVHCCH